MLDLLFGPRRRAAQGAAQDYWPPAQGRRRTQAGALVDEDLALTYSAVWCATRVICETAASLPLLTYRKAAGGDREQDPTHYLYDVLKTAPNPQMGSMAFREGRTMHQVNWGNGFAEVERDGRGRPAALWPIHPSRVRPPRPGETDRQGRDLAGSGYGYLVRNNDNTQVALRPEEMLHIPGVLSEDGVWGKGVIAYARESVGFGLGTERHGATQFGLGNLPKGIVYGTGMKDRDARQRFRAEWREVHGSPDSPEIAILPIEAKFERLNFSNEDAQFLGTRAHNVTEIARWYRIPPHMLAQLEGGASYASIEQSSIEFVIYGLLPWLRRWEEQIALKLLAPEERGTVFVEHLLAGLLRGDMASRFAAYNVALQAGFMTRNEVRRLENLNAVPGGDVLFVPLNMVPIERAGLPPEPPGGGADLADPEDAAEGDRGAELLDLPDRRQSRDYTCGAVAAWSVGDYFGVGPGAEEGWALLCGTTPEAGTRPGGILSAFADLGLAVAGEHQMGLEGLLGHFRAGRPVICPIQAPQDTARGDRNGHYVTVSGVGLGQVFFQDPILGRQMLAADEFLARWHDVETDGTEFVQYGIAVGEDLEDAEAEEEAPGADGEQPPEEPSGPAAPEARQRPGRAAAGAVLEGTLRRLLTKEANAAARAVKGTDFPAWLEEWQGRHRATLADALTPLAGILEGAGVRKSPADLALDLAAAGAAVLRHAYDTKTPGRFAELLAGWPDRAAALADEILGGEHP